MKKECQVPSKNHQLNNLYCLILWQNDKTTFMTLQIGRLKLFYISVTLLFLFFFAPNIRMLLIGKKSTGTVFKLSAFTAGEHNSRVNFIAENNIEYRFEVNSNVKGTAEVIYDPKNPTDAYLYNFMNFVLEKIIFSLLASIPATIFVFFFLKKNQYLFIDLKRFKFTKGLKKWTYQDTDKLQKLINEPLSYAIKPYEYAFLVNSDIKSTTKLITLTLQYLFIHKHIEITTKLVQVNKSDDTLKPRPFVRLGVEHAEENKYTPIEKELLTIFSTNESLRLHEVRMKLQQKFGTEFEKFHGEVVKPYFENTELWNQNKISEFGKQVLTEVNDRILFIERHLDTLHNELLLELSQLINHLDACWLCIPSESFETIKKAMIKQKASIDTDLITKISTTYQRIAIN